MMLHSVRHDYPEKAGFFITRPNGLSRYTFLHFSTPIQFRFGEETVDARAGACLFYAPQVPQWFYSSHDVIHNWLHAEPPFGELLERYGIPQNQLLYPGDTSFISDIFRKMEVEYYADRPHREVLIEGYLTEFLVRFSRALQEEAPTSAIPRKMQDTLRRVRRQILSAPDHRWTVAEMAELAALSPSRFHALYKTLFAIPPMQDVIEARIRYAKALLMADDRLPLTAVAEQLGYHDQYHFIRQFKSVVGTTPGHFRKHGG